MKEFKVHKFDRNWNNHVIVLVAYNWLKLVDRTKYGTRIRCKSPPIFLLIHITVLRYDIIGQLKLKQITWLSSIDVPHHSNIINRVTPWQDELEWYGPNQSMSSINVKVFLRLCYYRLTLTLYFVESSPVCARKGLLSPSRAIPASDS